MEKWLIGKKKWEIIYQNTYIFLMALELEKNTSKICKRLHYTPPTTSPTQPASQPSNPPTALFLSSFMFVCGKWKTMKKNIHMKKAPIKTCATADGLGRIVGNGGIDVATAFSNCCLH